MDIRNIIGHQQGPQLSISNTSVQTAPLEGGVYELYATCNSRIKIDHTNASDVTPASGAILLGGNSAFFQVPAGAKLGVVAESISLTGTLEYHWVRP